MFLLFNIDLVFEIDIFYGILNEQLSEINI